MRTLLLIISVLLSANTAAAERVVRETIPVDADVRFSIDLHRAELEVTTGSVDSIELTAYIEHDEQDDENILASAQGLLEDPRAEFRAYYLDYLLMYADEAYYDIEYLEALIDRETDPDCIELLYELLGIAERRQRSFITGA